MSIYTGKYWIKRKIYVLFIDNMLTSGPILISLALPEVDDEDEGRLCTQPNHKVRGFDISIDKAIIMQNFKPI